MTLMHLFLFFLSLFYTFDSCASAQLYLGLYLKHEPFYLLIVLLSSILIQYVVFKIFLKNIDPKKLFIAVIGSNAILVFLGFLLSFINRFFILIPKVIFLQSPLLVSLIICVWIQYLFIHYLILPNLSFDKIIYPLVVSNVIIDYLLYILMVIVYFCN